MTVQSGYSSIPAKSHGIFHPVLSLFGPIDLLSNRFRVALRSSRFSVHSLWCPGEQAIHKTINKQKQTKTKQKQTKTNKNTKHKKQQAINKTKQYKKQKNKNNKQQTNTQTTNKPKQTKNKAHAKIQKS